MLYNTRTKGPGRPATRYVSAPARNSLDPSTPGEKKSAKSSVNDSATHTKSDNDARSSESPSGSSIKSPRSQSIAEGFYRLGVVDEDGELWMKRGKGRLPGGVKSKFKIGKAKSKLKFKKLGERPWALLPEFFDEQVGSPCNLDYYLTQLSEKRLPCPPLLSSPQFRHRSLLLRPIFEPPEGHQRSLQCCGLG